MAHNSAASEEDGVRLRQNTVQDGELREAGEVSISGEGDERPQPRNNNAANTNSLTYKANTILSDPADPAEPDFTPAAALLNFRARKKTISEYLAPLTGLFSAKRTSLIGKLSSDRSNIILSDVERRRARELVIGTPMRRFSLTRSHNVQRSGTLRVRVISCVSPKLRSSTTIAKKGNSSPLAEVRKGSGESAASRLSNGGAATPPRTRIARRVQNLGLTPTKKMIHYYVEMELDGARGKTLKKETLKNSRRGEIRWDDSGAWVRLFVPGVEEGGDPILVAVSEAAKSVTGDHIRRPLQVLRLRVMCSIQGSNEDDSEVQMPLFETAVELDRLIAKGAPRIHELALVGREDPSDEDAGVLTIETRFERLNPRRMSNDELQFVEAAGNLAAETTSVLILAGRTPSFIEAGNEEVQGAMELEDSALSPVLMVPSAAAYLTTVAAGLVPTSYSTDKAPSQVSQKLRVVYEHDENLRASWPLCNSETARQRTATIFSDHRLHKSHRRFSTPAPSHDLHSESGEAMCGVNIEQLESLREGWRMWRLADRSQLQPSHRAQDIASAGERFINRASSSAYFPSSPSHSLSSHMSSSVPGSPTFSFLEDQSGRRARTLFELGGESYDISTYLEDHPHQRSFLNSISARIGKISKLEQQATLSDEEGSIPGGGHLGQRQPVKRRKPKRPPRTANVPLLGSWCRRKVAVLTGATSGIGEVIGKELCLRGVKRLVILVRNLSAGRVKALEWTEKYKNVEVDVVPCDLSDMREINDAVLQIRDLLEPKERIDLLILCAACLSNETSQRPKKEFEEIFAVNYMSNFLLVHALFDLMERSPEVNGIDGESRIIIAGCAAVPPLGNRIDLSNLQAERKGLGQLGVTQYIHTKTMLMCFAGELSRRLADRHCGVTANIFFPGAVKSKLADRVMESFNPVLARLADAAYGLTEGVFVRSPQQGATLALHLCSSHEVTGVNGKLFHSGLTGNVTDFEPHHLFGVATNTELCRKLWAISGKMLNQALGKDSRVAEWWGYFKPVRPNHAGFRGQGDDVLAE